MATGLRNVSLVQNPVDPFWVSCLQLLIPQPCFDTFLVDFDFFDVPCWRVLISKCLGYAVILGSILVKLPQIIKIFRSRSGEGLSLYSIHLELVGLLSTGAYGFARNFPISAYGDAFSLYIQTAIISCLVFIFRKQTTTGFMFALTYAAFLAAFLSPFVPLKLLTLMQACNMPIIATSKVIQIMSNHRIGSTGQLSAVTLIMLMFGSMARIFTSVQETGDVLVTMTYVVSTLCNCVLVGQLLYYWNTAKVKAA